MEREIGDIFEYFGTTLEVVKSDECDNCYFNHNGCSQRFTAITGVCPDWARSDETSVSFKEILKNNCR